MPVRSVAILGLALGALAAAIFLVGPQIPLGSAAQALGLTHAAPDDIRRQFSLCHSGGGANCVVDGDTIWLDGVKIRIADIDAPETHPPRCSSEADLGNRATIRLQQLLNAGAFSVVVADRDVDRYGRKLRIIERGGHSLGAILVGEGLAREWDGARHPWC